MLQTIEIKENEFLTYVKKDIVPAGSYLIFDDKKITNEDKLKFKAIERPGGKGFIHAWNKNKYLVLLPNYEYLNRYFNNYEFVINETLDNKQNKNTLMAIVDKLPLRQWQKLVFHQIGLNFDNNFKYKKGLNIPVGAGKTLLSLVLSEYCKQENKKCLILTEKHLIETIEQEANRWSLSLPTTLINYDNLTAKATKVMDKYDIIIVDECLKFKSGNNLLFSRLRGLCDLADVVICCTGTVTSGRDISDLSWLNLLGDIVPNHSDTWMYLYGINTTVETFIVKVSKKMIINGSETRILKDCLVQKVQCEDWNFNEIIKLVSPYLLSPIINDIPVPELSEETIFFNKPSYYGAVRGGMFGIAPGSNFYQLLEATSGFVTNAKKETIELEKEHTCKMAWILNWLNENKDKQLIVYSFYKYEQALFANYLKKNKITYCFNNGAMKKSELFLNKKARVLICSSQMTEGLNLQYNADTCVFLSYSWHPVKLVQGIGRIKRQGQKSSLVKVYHLICTDTMDMHILQTIEKHVKHLDILNKKSST